MSEDGKESRVSTPDAVKVLTTLQNAPWEYDFFAAARRLDASHPGPGFGRSTRPEQDPVRFGQRAEMAFPTRSIDSLAAGAITPIVKLLFSGLLGAGGPLPAHLTEWSEDRRKHHNDDSFEAFADIFHHRFFSLLYRAWADADPAVCLDREDGFDPYAKFIGSLGGVYKVGALDFKDLSRRFYMTHIGPSSSRPEALERIFADFFRVPAKIEEFVGMWLEVPEEDRVTLGNTGLGDGMVIGKAIWSRTTTFEIVLGPMDKAEFEKFLPGKQHNSALREIVIANAGMDYDWRLRLRRKPRSITGSKLGEGARLGYDAWMGTGKAVKETCDDMVISGDRYQFG